MKKATQFKLISLLLLIIPIMYFQCTKQNELSDNVIFKSGLPYYTALNNKHAVDSIKLLNNKHTKAELVYFKDGNIVIYYNALNIRNLALRKLYLEYLEKYRELNIKLSTTFPTKDINYILFNAYLEDQQLPILTLYEYNKVINTSAKTQLKNYFVLQTILGITIFIIILGGIAFYLVTLLDNQDKKESVNDS